MCHEQDDRDEAFDKNIEDKEGDKEDEAECVYEEREAITLVICRAALVVSCPQAIGDQHPLHYTPYLIFVNFGAPPHYLSLYKGQQKVRKFMTK